MKLTDAVMEGILVALTAEDAVFDPAAVFVGVALDIDDRNGETTLADVTPGVGNMAVRKAVTSWTAPYKLSSGSWVTDANVVFWVPASDADAGQFFWFYLASLLTLGVLKGYGMLPAPPYDMVNADSRLSLVVRLTIAPNGVSDVSVAWNG